MGRKKGEETGLFQLVFPKFWRWPWVCGQAADEVQSQVTSNGPIHYDSNQSMTTIAGFCRSMDRGMSEIDIRSTGPQAGTKVFYAVAPDGSAIEFMQPGN